MTRADQEELHRIGYPRYYAAGSVIIRQNERSNYVLVIQSGCVKVASVTPDGYHTVLALRDTGDLLGELATLDGQPRSATLYALTDVEVLVIPAGKFERFRKIRPAVDRMVQRILASRLRESGRSLATAGADSVVQRLAQTLLSLGKRYGTPEPEGIRINLPLSQDDLAGLTFTSRRTVGRVLAEWRQSGWISTGRRSILLKDVPALKALRLP